ncbi:hypothetical protein OPIT5_17435 [Opitutaceae bacterium TAV5]|nr:hypothetical protein OPIT5_17435 [Opitutaceae bacterium TAV5]
MPSTILDDAPGYKDPHGGTISVAFADGHVESRKLEGFPAASSTEAIDRLLWRGE